MRDAIAEKDFAAFSELTMRDSNEMHACCLDTFPPISYMNDVSRQIQTLVHHINRLHARPVVSTRLGTLVANEIKTCKDISHKTKGIYY